MPIAQKLYATHFDCQIPKFPERFSNDVQKPFLQPERFSNDVQKPFLQFLYKLILTFGRSKMFLKM